jgi:hypothetical protein
MDLKPTDDPVIVAAQRAFGQRLRNSVDVSENTRNAQAIAKVWRSEVHSIDQDRFQIEALVSPDLDQKIDVIDTETYTAYEFKVSGKNSTGEFYKDIVKVILWNEKRKRKIPRLVFITEEEWGGKHLNTPMPRAYIKYLAGLGLQVSVEYVRHDRADGAVNRP